MPHVQRIAIIIWTQTDGLNCTWESMLLHKFDEPVWRLSWSVTGNILAVSSDDSTVTLWKQNLDKSWGQVSMSNDSKGVSGYVID